MQSVLLDPVIRSNESVNKVAAVKYVSHAAVSNNRIGRQPTANQKVNVGAFFEVVFRGRNVEACGFYFAVCCLDVRRNPAELSPDKSPCVEISRVALCPDAKIWAAIEKQTGGEFAAHAVDMRLFRGCVLVLFIVVVVSSLVPVITRAPEVDC